jgi:hypothetical protein
VALLLAAPAVHAQVGDVSGIDYPGWIPSDRVAPVISTTVEYEESGNGSMERNGGYGA